VAELPHRSATDTAAAEAPYFLPGAEEATSVEVRRRAAGGAAARAMTLPQPVLQHRDGSAKEKEADVRPLAPSGPTMTASTNRHLRFRVLIAVPLVSATVLALAMAMSGPDRAGLYRAELAIVEALGFWGCLAAALIFDGGDYLRRAWLLEMSCYGLIFVGDLTLTTGVFSGKPWTALANGVLTLTANAGAMGGTFLLARTARVAGIEMPGSDVTRRGVQALALAFALLAAGPAAIISARHVFEGDHSGLMYFASCLGDIFCFSLIAPLLLTTVAMRGGLLAWPWGFMTASGLAWLTYDAVQTLSPIVLGISVEDARPLLEVARCVACTCAFSAGLAQRWTILEVSS
jgi:hypothetical protein